MKDENSILNRSQMVIAIFICGLVAMIISGAWVLRDVERTLINHSNITTSRFTSIMDGYSHTFLQYEKYLQLELEKESDPAVIAQFMKSKDKQLNDIEGADYDGVYMYYKGRYLYSWDTPESVYEARGYDATQRPWYKGALAAEGEIYFSVPYRSYANDYMLATVSRLQPDGQTVIAYDIKLWAIQHFAEKLDVYDGALTLICDREGNIIGATNKSYTGGNYNYTAEDYDKQIETAKMELAQAVDEKEQTKANKKIYNLQELKKFTSKYQSCIDSVLETPDQAYCNFVQGVVSFQDTNGRYRTIIMVPVMNIMPQVVMMWLVVFTVLVLMLLLIINIKMRLLNADELAIKNAQLAEVAIKADAASVAKSQFLAQMSHEIRTPMNAVIGLTTIAKSEVNAPEKTAEYLAKIESSSRLLLSIINDVLDMSSIEGGKLKIDSHEFNFKNLLSNITTVFYEQARQKGIHFEVRMNGITEEKIIGDELRVNQILMNLLSNAIKFTPANGSIDLMVIQASRSQDKLQLRFSVSDTGSGMSEEMLGRLFRPFEQESASTARKHGGSGLGLSITKKLVEMMGGSIQVQSSPGKGSMFTVDLPFHVSHKPDEVQEVKEFNEIHTLVVDDSEEACEYCGILLDRLGVRYEYVLDGEAALEALEEAEDKDDPFNLCLIDWKMPGMNGGELTKQIREIFGRETLVIILSAYDLNEIEGCEGFTESNYFMPKPLFQSTLFNALMKISGGDYTKIEAQHENNNYDFSGKNVLVAEDVAMNMEVAVKLLKMVGVDATCAEDGKQAVDMFVRSKPGTFDCILLDINMPIMDGYDTARAIRKVNRPDAATIPIYAMTANAFSEDVTAALNAGMNGHIAKPIETKVLYSTLANAFQKEQNQG